MISSNITKKQSKKDQCTIFIVIEQSQALSCEAQKAIKDSMEVLLERIRVWSRDNHIHTYIDCLEYSENARWITSHGPEPVDEFIWEGMNGCHVDNSTPVCFGKALNKLDEKLNSLELTHVPDISSFFFFLAGTDSSDEYLHNAEQLGNNPLYVYSNKLAINVCCGVKSPMLSATVNSGELVITNSDLYEFLKIFFATHYQGDSEDSNAKSPCNDDEDFLTMLHTKEPVSLAEIVLPYTSVKLNEYKIYEFNRCQLGPCKPEVALSTAISLSIMDGNEWDIDTLLTNHMEEVIAVVKTIKPQRSCWIPFENVQGNLTDGIEVIHDINSDNAGRGTLSIKIENDCLYIKNTSPSEEVFIKVTVRSEGSIFLDQHDKIYTADLSTCLMTFRDLLAWD